MTSVKWLEEVVQHEELRIAARQRIDCGMKEEKKEIYSLSRRNLFGLYPPNPIRFAVAPKSIRCRAAIQVGSSPHAEKARAADHT